MKSEAQSKRQQLNRNVENIDINLHKCREFEKCSIKFPRRFASIAACICTFSFLSSPVSPRFGSARFPSFRSRLSFVVLRIILRRSRTARLRDNIDRRFRRNCSARLPLFRLRVDQRRAELSHGTAAMTNPFAATVSVRLFREYGSFPSRRAKRSEIDLWPSAAAKECARFYFRNEFALWRH